MKRKALGIILTMGNSNERVHRMRRNAGTTDVAQTDTATETAAPEKTTDGNVYKVGIVQYVDDASLNQIEFSNRKRIRCKGRRTGCYF